MSRATVVILKVLIAALFALVLTGQFAMLPLLADDVAANAPELGYLRWPGVILGGLFLVCVEIVLVCVWRLLTMVAADSIFSARAFTWVNVIIGAVIAATVLVAGGFIAFDALGALSPAVMIACVFAVIVGCGLFLLVVVLRGLLRKAARLEQEMAEVV